MERKIGEIFEYNGEWYQCVVATQGCRECSFCAQDDCTRYPECISIVRSDKTSVIFKKLEKVGEPFTSVGKLYQHYKVFDIDNVSGDVFWCVHNYKAKTLTIELKQDKEDMKENKLNLKPFDIQKAREGKPVCTRDGRKARIICFDRKNNTPIVALIECVNHAEILQCAYNDGKCFQYDTSNNDLMMLPEKKEGWVNVYREESNNDERLIEQTIYKTRKDAFDNACPKGYITTTKINWEE